MFDLLSGIFVLPLGVIATGTALALSAAATVASAAVQSNAAKKAAQAQTSALNEVKPVDVEKVSADAKAADLAKYREQFKLLDQVDPGTGALRTASNEGLSENIGGTEDANSKAILQSLFDSSINLDPNDAAFQAALKAEAARQLSLGGDFSPEQQAEFVRAGLEQGAQGGFQAGSSALRQGVGKLLASEKEALGNSRRAMAQQLFGFATDLDTGRTNKLLGISSASRDASTADFSKLFSLANLADSRVPDIGLSGADRANLAISNTNTANNVALQKGAVQANKTSASGQIASGLLGGLTQLPGQYLTLKGTGTGTTDAIRKRIFSGI